MSDPTRSANRLVELAATTPGEIDRLKDKTLEELQNLAQLAIKQLPEPALVSDKWVYRTVVGSLGIVAIAAILGAIILSARVQAGATVQIPDVLTALGAAAIGALAGLLAPSPAGK